LKSDISADLIKYSYASKVLVWLRGTPANLTHYAYSGSLLC